MHLFLSQAFSSDKSPPSGVHFHGVEMSGSTALNPSLCDLRAFAVKKMLEPARGG
jgi:hypothetical protein